MNLNGVLVDGDAAEGRRVWLADLGDQHEVEVCCVQVEAAVVDVQVEVDHQGVVGAPGGERGRQGVISFKICVVREYRQVAPSLNYTCGKPSIYRISIYRVSALSNTVGSSEIQNKVG